MKTEHQLFEEWKRKGLVSKDGMRYTEALYRTRLRLFKAYLDEGFVAFPLKKRLSKPRDKKEADVCKQPLQTGWQDVELNIDTVRPYLQTGFGIGLNLGASGLKAADYDDTLPKGNFDGAKYVSATPNGRYHLIFDEDTDPADIPPGYESIRGEGLLVVLPLSIYKPVFGPTRFWYWVKGPFVELQEPPRNLWR